MPFKRPETAVSFDPGINNFAVAVWVDKEPTQLFLVGAQKQKIGKRNRKDKIPVSHDDQNRVRHVMREVGKIVAEINPHFMVSEIPAGARNAGSAKHLAFSAAVLAHLQVVFDIPIYFVTPQAIKKHYGEGSTGKPHIIAKALRQFPDLNWPTDKHGKLAHPSVLEHCADAIGAFESWRVINGQSR